MVSSVRGEKGCRPQSCINAFGFYQGWKVRNPLYDTLQKVFSISQAIALIMNVLSSASLVLRVMTIRTSVMDLEEQNIFCLLLRRLFLLR